MSEPSADPAFFEREIAKAAKASGVELPAAARALLAAHVLRVLRRNERLHLTTITDPHELVARHVAEGFEGAALLPADVSGTLIDIGTGNGFPALPLLAVRPGLRGVLVEASRKKAAFLTAALLDWGALRVVERQVQRASDLADVGLARVLTMRAVGGWHRLLPKLTPALAPDGVALLWAGEEVEQVRGRVAWRRLELRQAHRLAKAEQASIWVFSPNRDVSKT